MSCAFVELSLLINYSGLTGFRFVYREIFVLGCSQENDGLEISIQHCLLEFIVPALKND